MMIASRCYKGREGGRPSGTTSAHARLVVARPHFTGIDAVRPSEADAPVRLDGSGTLLLHAALDVGHHRARGEVRAVEREGDGRGAVTLAATQDVHGLGVNLAVNTPHRGRRAVAAIRDDHAPIQHV